MKNKIAYLLFFAGVVVAAGCNKKFLEEMKSYDKYDESIFTNEAQTGWYIDRLYNYYFASYRNPMQTVVGLYSDTRRSITEEVGAGGTVNDYINPNKNLNLASQADGYYGAVLGSSAQNHPYTRIRYANFLLEKIDGIGQVLPEEFRKTAKGQMFFFRALQYFDLVRVYGGIPIVTEVQNASADDESIKTPRAKTSEVFDQIISDFDSAAALLPLKWTTATTDYGRFTAAAALAMKSRVLLTAASPLFNPNWDNAGDARWQKALDASLAAETALIAAGYGNAINSAKDWAEVTFKNDNSFNGEGLFVVLLSNTTTSTGVNSSWENSLRPKDHNGGGGISVPKGMIDLFPLATGVRPTAANGYNDTFFFENRDPRFYRTFAFSGAKWGFKSNANKGTWLYRWRSAATGGTTTYFAGNQTISPVLVRKMSNPQADSAGFTFSGTDIFDYRFGELLLNIAECYAAKGDIGNCIKYLGKIRGRVGIPQGANNWGIGTPADKYAALEAVLYERRVELAYEGKRFWDLQRWMLYGDDAGAGDNTNTKLGIAQLNGTNRTGYYWQSKTFATAANDPLAADKNISIDPDAANFQTEIGKLKALYQSKLVMTPLDQPMDRDGNNAVNILYRQNYYISGLQPAVLSNNDWLPQTIGWQDYNGALGTFDYKQ
jgi:starch-binding outer membrane protein, SusD/RagB family